MAQLLRMGAIFGIVNANITAIGLRQAKVQCPGFRPRFAVWNHHEAGIARKSRAFCRDQRVLIVDFKQDLNVEAIFGPIQRTMGMPRSNEVATAVPADVRLRFDLLDLRDSKPTAASLPS